MKTPYFETFFYETSLFWNLLLWNLHIMEPPCYESSLLWNLLVMKPSYYESFQTLTNFKTFLTLKNYNYIFLTLSYY